MKSLVLSRIATALIAVTVLGAAAGCNRKSDHASAGSTAADSASASSPAAANAESVSAVAKIAPTEGNDVRGTVRFVKEGDRVRVIADLTGLTPGEHGFHVHENGDCSAPDASSAGGHFNPGNQPHAGHEAHARHVGDMGNITADSSGKAHLDYVDSMIALSGPNSVVGRSVIVHAGRDDLKSQPSGDAGKRVGCGLITMEGAPN